MQSPLQGGQKVKMRNWSSIENAEIGFGSRIVRTQQKSKLLLLKASEEFLDINFPNLHGLTPLMLAVRDVDLFESLNVLTVYKPAEVLTELLRHRA